MIHFAIIFISCILLGGFMSHAGERVVLLHGLCRSSDSMKKMELALEKSGYEVFNIDYPSRKETIEELTEDIYFQVRTFSGGKPVHFVTHSMGGIIVRQLAKAYPDVKINRVVMLSPPNHGSEVTDKLHDWALYKWLNGPAGQQLGTESTSLVNRLGPANFEVGILTGDRSINWILSMMIPGDDDGKVSIESARLEGMKDFKVIHATHPFIMKKGLTIKLVKRFLENGCFSDEP